MEGGAQGPRESTTKMDDRARILASLVDRSQDACGLSSRLGISRNPLSSLLMKMEKEGLIEWKGQEWAVKPASDSKQSDLPDTRHPPEKGPGA